MLNVQHLPSALFGCYSSLRNSSSGCFSASDIFVLWYFQLLVISKVPKHCPVQHLFKYLFLGTFEIASSEVCFSQESISVLFALLSVENQWLFKVGRVLIFFWIYKSSIDLMLWQGNAMLYRPPLADKIVTPIL